MKLAGSTKLLLLKFSPKYLPDIDRSLELAGIKAFDKFFVRDNIFIRLQFFEV
jgi:hypothetical protein